MSELGETFAGQKKYPDAERKLLDSIEALKKSPQPQGRKETILRLAWLHDRWNKPVEAAKWQAELTRQAGPTSP